MEDYQYTQANPKDKSVSWGQSYLTPAQISVLKKNPSITKVALRQVYYVHTLKNNNQFHLYFAAKLPTFQ